MGLSFNDFGTLKESWFLRFNKWFLVVKIDLGRKRFEGLGLDQGYQYRTEECTVFLLVLVPICFGFTNIFNFF